MSTCSSSGSTGTQTYSIKTTSIGPIRFRCFKADGTRWDLTNATSVTINARLNGQLVTDTLVVEDAATGLVRWDYNQDFETPGFWKSELVVLGSADYAGPSEPFIIEVTEGIG